MQIEHQQNSSFSIAQITEGQSQYSVEVLMGRDLVVKLGHIDFKICQMNAQIISSLTKSIYSCRNAIYKGTFLQMVKLFNKKSNVKKERNIEKLQKVEI